MLVGLAPPAARGQETAAVVQRDLEYRAARDSYQAALQNLRAQNNAFASILDTLAGARRGDDEELVRQLEGQAYGFSREIARLDRRVQEQRDSLDNARSRLLGALDDRLDRVQSMLSENPVPSVRQDLEAEARDLRRQYLELEAEGGNVLTPRNVMYPAMQPSPRDTPADLRLKVQFAERKVEEAKAQLGEVDRQIQRLENLVRTQRSGRDFMGQLNRFGDTEVPTGPPGQARERIQDLPTDTTGALSIEDLPPEQRLEVLRLFREQVQVQIDVLEDRVRVLKERLPHTDEAMDAEEPR